MFSRTTEYALRAAAHLGYAHGTGEALTVGQMAERTQVPPDYLSKVLQTLVRAGIVHSQRGSGGGFRLARAPRELTVLDVVQAVEPVERIKHCPLGLKAHGQNLCPLHRKMDEALELIETSLGETSLQDVLEGESPAGPLSLSMPLCSP